MGRANVFSKTHSRPAFLHLSQRTSAWGVALGGWGVSVRHTTYLLQRRAWPAASAPSTTMQRALTALQASQDRRIVPVRWRSAGPAAAAALLVSLIAATIYFLRQRLAIGPTDSAALTEKGLPQRRTSSGGEAIVQPAVECAETREGGCLGRSGLVQYYKGGLARLVRLGRCMIHRRPIARVVARLHALGLKPGAVQIAAGIKGCSEIPEKWGSIVLKSTTALTSPRGLLRSGQWAI